MPTTEKPGYWDWRGPGSKWEGQDTSKKAAPPPQDYAGEAEKQAASSAANTQAQILANRPNTTTPFGSTQWTQNPDGSWSMTNQLGAGMQGAAQSAQQQLADALGKPLPTGEQAREQAIQAAYGQATSRLDPQWDKREAMLRAQLLNQGLDPTSEAARNAGSELGLARNDAYTSAMNAAIGQGTQAGESIFRQGLASQQAPLQALQGMFGLLGQPGFQGAGRADATQYLPAAQYAGQDAMSMWRTQQEMDADRMNALMNLLGTGTSLATKLA